MPFRLNAQQNLSELHALSLIVVDHVSHDRHHLLGLIANQKAGK